MILSLPRCAGGDPYYGKMLAEAGWRRDAALAEESRRLYEELERRFPR